MVKIGLDSFSYHVNMATMDSWSAADWFLERVGELGLQGCQFDPMHLDGWNEPLIRRISDYCSHHGMYLELGTGGFDYERLSHRLLLASDVGARVLRTFIGGERHETSQQRREELIGYTVENFKRLAEVAERVRVPLVFENHEDLTSIEVLSILKAVGSPYVQALIDNGNALPVRENPVECVLRLAPHASACHLKDWKFCWVNDIPMRQGCPLGEGDACAAESYRILRDAQPDMPITMEIASIRFDRTSQSVEEEDTNVVKSVRFLKTLDSSSTNSFED